MKDRETLEIEKLDLEVRALARPMWARPTTWAALVTVAASVLGMVWQTEAAARARSLAAIQVQRAELTLEKTRRSIADAQAELDALVQERQELSRDLEELRDEGRRLSEAAVRAPVGAAQLKVFTDKLDEIQRRNGELLRATSQIRIAPRALDSAPTDRLEIDPSVLERLQPSVPPGG